MQVELVNEQAGNLVSAVCIASLRRFFPCPQHVGSNLAAKQHKMYSTLPSNLGTQLDIL